MDEGTDARDILENRILPLRRGASHIQPLISLYAKFLDPDYVSSCAPQCVFYMNDVWRVNVMVFDEHRVLNAENMMR